ncbi:type II secretion system protein [Candidatus Parcubacteria bacterium]|jgi:type II secretory pathway pseudopilin PulG|nr:type II secretion system protein [Candidatus Parcubacteria bacterium]
MDFPKERQGLTLVGLIMVTMIIVILGSAVFMWVDPVAKIGEAKDQRRREAVLMLAEAIAEYTHDHKGALPVLGSVVNGTKKVLCESQGGSNVSCSGDSADCLRIAHRDFYSDYLQQLPIDPDKSANTDTGYYLEKDSNGQLVVGACSTYGSSAITKTTSVSVSCLAYAGGYCWEIATATTDDCDAVCSDADKVCVEKVKYGPDVDSSGTAYCDLNMAFGAACGTVCFEASAPGFTPANLADGSICGTRTTFFDCTNASAGYNNICPCE